MIALNKPIRSGQHALIIFSSGISHKPKSKLALSNLGLPNMMIRTIKIN